MSNWLNDFPFAWLAIVALGSFYIVVTAIYTRVMIWVSDKQEHNGAKKIREAEATHSQPVAITPSNAASSHPTARADNTGAVVRVWDRLTSADIQRVRRDLAVRRSEMLMRHAKELKVLDTEQTEIDAIELAINVFTQRFGVSTTEVSPIQEKTCVF
jgi:hypothetical protein